jgi:asparagine N-glycosylation enzyme membrane subunit Stt3
MPRYDLAFLVAALSFAVAGMAMGIWMGIAHDFALAPAHAHLNLVGFAALAVYALVHRGWPELARSPVGPFQFWAAVLGAPVLSAGIAVSIKTGQPAIAIAGSFLVIAGPLLMLAMVAALYRRREAAA